MIEIKAIAIFSWNSCRKIYFGERIGSVNPLVSPTMGELSGLRR